MLAGPRMLGCSHLLAVLSPAIFRPQRQNRQPHGYEATRARVSVTFRVALRCPQARQKSLNRVGDNSV